MVLKKQDIFLYYLFEIILDKIDFIFPAHDSVVLKLAQHAHEFKAKIITSSLETNEICRSKEKTYKKFQGIIPISNAISLPQGKTKTRFFILYINTPSIIKYV